MKVATILINFNSGKYIFECIDSISRQTYPSEIIVVDNNSSDGSKDKLILLNDTKVIKYYFLDKNVGSSAANNFGINAIEADAYLIINADIILDLNYLKYCVDELLYNFDTGVVVGKFLNYYDKTVVDGCGVNLYYECIATERGARSLNTDTMYPFREEVLAVCCAAALYRKKALDQIVICNGQYFDENYFAFYEDLDLSFRLNLIDYKNIYIPNAIAFHVRGGSTSTQSEFVRYLCILNTDLFYYKYLHSISKFRILRILLIIHRLIIYNWCMLIDISKDLKKIKVNQCLNSKKSKMITDKFVKESYYFSKIINFFYK